MTLAKITLTPTHSGQIHDVCLFDVLVTYFLSNDEQEMSDLHQRTGSSVTYVDVPTQRLESGTILLSLRGARADQFSPRIVFQAYDIQWSIEFTLGQRELLQCYDDIYVFAVRSGTNAPLLYITPDANKARAYHWNLLIGRYKSLLRGTFAVQMTGPETNEGYTLTQRDQEIVDRYFLTRLVFRVPAPRAYCILYDNDRVWVGREGDASAQIHKVTDSPFYSYVNIPDDCKNFCLFKRPQTQSQADQDVRFNDKNYTVRYRSSGIVGVTPQKSKI